MAGNLIGGKKLGSTPSGISGSRAAAVLGLSEWSTPFDVWQKIMEEREPGFNAKRGYTLPEFKEGAPLRWGLAFEDAIVRLSENAEGTEIIDRERLFSVPGLDYITCHIDGAYNDISGNYLKLHEAKTTSSFIYRKKWGEPGTDKIPRNYQLQVQHQMMCTGADETIVSVLVFPKMVDDWEKEGWEVFIDPYDTNGNGEWIIKRENEAHIPDYWAAVLSQMGYFFQYPVKRNQELIDLMLKKYISFWNYHVLTREPPEPVNYDDIKRLTPEPVGTIIANEQLERWAREYKEIGEELGSNGSLKKRREQLKVMILDWMRKQDATLDDESRDKTILMDSRGHKLVSYNGKTFR